jgi:hypothetical protein
MGILIRSGDSVVPPLTFVPLEQGLRVDEATIADSLGREFLQAALDCAWANGLRPAGFNDVPQTMAATRSHLADMRAIVFAQLGVSQP